MDQTISEEHYHQSRLSKRILKWEDTFLEFKYTDLRELEDPLSGIDAKKYDGIKSLGFLFCHIDPQILIKMLKKLKKVKNLDLEYCACHELPYDSVPVFKRMMASIDVSIDLQEEDGDLYDCSHILLHPKIKLPCRHLSVLRYEKGSHGLSPGSAYRTYLTSYVDRFQDDIKYILFDSGHPSLWRRLVKDSKIKTIEFGVQRNLDRWDY